MTAVSAIVFFLGLLFGFQRPSRLLPLRPCATVLLLLGCIPFNFGAALFISKRLFCQATVVASFSPLRLVWIQHRAVAPCFFLSRGAESTSLPHPLSTCFVDSFFRLASAFAASRGAASTTAASRVNFARRLRISFFHFFVRGLRRQCDFAFPSEGPRLLSPPRSESTPYCRLRIPPTWSRRQRDVPVWRGAASTTAASRVNTLLRLHLPAASAWRTRHSAAPTPCRVPLSTSVQLGEH